MPRRGRGSSARGDRVRIENRGMEVALSASSGSYSAPEVGLTRLTEGMRVSDGNRALAMQLLFREMKPPVFRGDEEPVEADFWISSVEQIFRALQIEEDDLRMATAPLFLRGLAGRWWNTQTEVYGQSNATWATFRGLFLNMFFPEPIRERKHDEFAGLIQGDMTVHEYKLKFVSLSRYAPELVSTERLRCRQFMRGLRPSIRVMVAAGLHETFKRCVESAMMAEDGVPHADVSGQSRLWVRLRVLECFMVWRLVQEVEVSMLAGMPMVVVIERGYVTFLFLLLESSLRLSRFFH